MTNKSTATARKTATVTQHPFTKKLADVSEQVLNTVDSSVDTIQKTTQQSAKKLEHYIHDNPLRAVFIALAAGALAAVLLKK